MACVKLTKGQENRVTALLKEAKLFGQDPAVRQLGDYGKIL